jgi:hypothetical protein
VRRPADEPADRARRQDADEGPRPDRADNPTAMGIAGQIPGERAEHLPAGRRQAEHTHGE